MKLILFSSLVDDNSSKIRIRGASISSKAVTINQAEKGP